MFNKCNKKKFRVMKINIFILLLFLKSVGSLAQTNASKIWTKSFGNNANNYCFRDGFSGIGQDFHAPKLHFSNSNLKSAYFTTTSEFFNLLTINMIDSNGLITFSKTIKAYNGGFYGNDMVQLPDSNYLIAFPTCSLDSTKTRDPKGGYGEFYLLKMERNTGTILWQKNYGGSDYSDGNFCTLEIRDNAIYVFSSARSNDGDVVGWKGGDDIWMLKLDMDGNVIKSKCIGGTKYEYFLKFVTTDDNGFIIMGNSNSNDSDFNASHGQYDAVIAKVDSNLNLVWKKQIGGSNYDIGKDLIKTIDGNYILVIKTESSDGDIPYSPIIPGSYKGFLYCFDENGMMIWKKLMDDDMYVEKIVQRADSSFIVIFSENKFSLNSMRLYFYDKTLNQRADSLFYYGSNFKISVDDAIINNEDKLFISGISAYGVDFTDNHGGTDVFISCIKLAKIIVPIPTKPKPPANLSATEISKKSVRLNWTDSSNNETSFKLYYSYNDSLNYFLKSNIGKNKTSYIDTPVHSNRIVYYKICASNAIGQSTFSNQVSVIIHDDSIKAPTNLTAKVIGSKGVELNWNDCKDETLYEVYRSINDSLNFKWYHNISANDTILLDTFSSVPHKVNLYYKVRSLYTSSATSPFSNITTAIVWNTGITQFKNLKEPIKIYPTAVSQYLNIENSMKCPVQLFLYGNTGQLLYCNSIEDSIQLNLEGYSSGIYYIILMNDKIKQQLKFIKM